jgi:hypothetical protein
MKTGLKKCVKIGSFAFLLIFISFLPACQDDNPTQPNNKSISVNDYFLSLPSWQSFSPQLHDTTEIGQPEIEFDYQNQVTRITTPCSITRTPEKIVTYSPSSEILYIGSLIQGDSYLGGLGTMEELPIRQRAPIKVSIDLLFNDNFRVVDNPDLASVQQAIGELISAADSTSHVAGSSIFFNQTTSHSVEQSALKLGLSASFMGASVKSSLDWNKSSETNTVSAYFIQKMFTTSMVLPQRPSDLFNNDFTNALLNEQIDLGRIGPDNVPVYVSNIVWGRMMMLTMTSSFEVESMKAALRASYAGISASVGAQHLDVLQNSEIRLVTVGGDQTAALNYLRTGQLGSFFETNAPLTSAVPISYTLRNLGDNSIAKISETTSYDMVEYKPFDIIYFSNEVDWKNAVQTAGFNLTEFETNALNISKANELGGVIPGHDTGIGTHLTFEKVTGDSLSFNFMNTGVDSGTTFGLTYWDANEGFPEGTISIGDIDNYQNDDFDVIFKDLKVYAFTLYIGDNVFSSDEVMEVAGVDAFTGNEVLWKEFYYNEMSPFIGLISPIPLGRISFDESADGDDIYVKDFKFGTLK